MRSQSSPPQKLPDVVPRFFVNDAGVPMVELIIHRNPHYRPVMAVTDEIAAEYPAEFEQFMQEQEEAPHGEER